jgi:hypothetical protein
MALTGSSLGGSCAVSLLLQGLSMPLLIHALNLAKTPAATGEQPILKERLHAVQDALLALG